MVNHYPYNKERIDEIVDHIIETICTVRKTIRVAWKDYSDRFVKADFLMGDNYYTTLVAYGMVNWVM